MHFVGLNPLITSNLEWMAGLSFLWYESGIYTKDNNEFKSVTLYLYFKKLLRDRLFFCTYKESRVYVGNLSYYIWNGNSTSRYVDTFHISVFISYVVSLQYYTLHFTFRLFVKDFVSVPLGWKQKKLNTNLINYKFITPTVF